MLKIGVIGYGNRIGSVIRQMMGFKEDICLKSIADIDFSNVKSRLKKEGFDEEKINLYKNTDEMLSKENLDGVLVGTRCSLHSKMGIKVLKNKIPLYIEKPLATNINDLMALKKIADEYHSEAVVSFPLKATPVIKLVKDIVDSGKLGTIEHVQAVNNVPYGGVYFHNWYRDEHETGGLFLQKATHDFDYINYLLGIKAAEICAMTSKQIFKGNHEELYCKDCNEKNTCPEGPYVMKFIKQDDPLGDMCCFAKDTGNEDSGSAIVRYESGMHVNYSQNFFVRKSAGMRGARLIGYNGTLQFDFYKDEVNVFMHNTDRVESYKLDSSQISHWGGDHILSLNFINVMKGFESSISPINAGLESTLMCLKARESAETGTFQKIEWPQ